MKKYILVFAFCLSFLILFSWMSSVALQARSAPEVKLVITGYDPRDLLSGHYIRYQIDWDKSDCTQFKQAQCPRQDFRGSQRFYVSEAYAPQLDDLFRRSQFDPSITDVFEVVYAYPKNRAPIAKRLLINGQDWKEVIH